MGFLEVMPSYVVVCSVALYAALSFLIIWGLWSILRELRCEIKAIHKKLGAILPTKMNKQKNSEDKDVRQGNKKNTVK